MFSNFILSVLLCFLLFSIFLNNCTQHDCYNTNDCSQTRLTCTNNEECVINCNGDRSCEQTVIQCPVKHSCTVNCLTSNRRHSLCQQLIINATLSTLLTVSATARNTNLELAIIYCPLRGNCILSGGGHHSMQQLTIYARKGFSCVSINCEGCFLKEMHCSQQFEHSCNINPSNNRCNPVCPKERNDQICNGNLKDCSKQMLESYMPTDIPTITPTEISAVNSTKYRSINPTQSPSHIHSVNPTLSPSKYHSINPSETPSHIPSENPTKYPSQFPTNLPSINPTETPSTNPTHFPSKKPSLHPTPLPTSPGTLICPDSIRGPYNGGILAFEVQIPFNGDLTFDASQSQFELIELNAFANNVTSPGNAGLFIQTSNNSDILTLIDIPINNYIFTIEGDKNGIFDVRITCQSANPTLSPTVNPTVIPTTQPSTNPTTAALYHCDYKCTNATQTDTLQIHIDLHLQSYVSYINDTLDCFMFHIVSQHLIDIGFIFAHNFTVCDTQITAIIGGNINTLDSTLCNGRLPCFANTNVMRRMIDAFDGNLTVIVTGTDTYNTDALIFPVLADKIRNTFIDIFGLNFWVTITKSDTFEIVDNIINNPNKETSPELTERESIEPGLLIPHFSGTRAQWICVGIFLGILLVLFPFQIYYTFKLYSARYSPFIHSRHPVLVTFTNLTASLFLIFERPLHAIHRLSVYNTLWLQWLRLLLYYTAMHLLLGFVILRFWLLLLDIKWVKSMTNKEWKKHIDYRLNSAKQSFWRRSHKTLGNYKYMRKYVVTFALATSAIPAFLVFVYQSTMYGSMAHGMILGIGTLLLYLLWKKTPIFDDEFKIMSECGYVVTWMMAAIVMDLLFTSVKVVMNEETFWVWFLSYSVPFLLLTGVIFLQSYWVLLQMNDSIKMNSNTAYKTRQITQRNLLNDNDNDEIVLSPSILNNQIENMTLSEVLKDKLCCYEFISHLCKEFSCENILSVIEMTQLKQFFCKWKLYIDCENMKRINRNDSDVIDYSSDEIVYDNNECDNNEKKDSEMNILLKNNNGILRYKSDYSDMDDLALHGTEIIELPQSLPQSTIVWDVPMEMVTLDDMSHKIEILFEKYIKQGCELELNISYKLRREMTKKYQKLCNESDETMDEVRLYAFFDSVIESMMQLMQDSYTRFRMTKSFLKYESGFVKRRLSNNYSLKDKIKRKMSPHLSFI